MNEQKKIIDALQALKSPKISIEIKEGLFNSEISYDVKIIKEITMVSDNNRTYLETKLSINNSSRYDFVRISLKKSMFIYLGIKTDSFIYKCMETIRQSTGGVLLVEDNEVHNILSLNGKGLDDWIVCTKNQSDGLKQFADRIEGNAGGCKYYFI